MLRTRESRWNANSSKTMKPSMYRIVGCQSPVLEPEGAAIGRQLLRDLQRLRRDVAAFCAGQWGREVHVQTVTTDLDNAIRAIKFGIPYAKCPLQPDEGCTLCAGSGWVSRAKWAGVPDELKRTNGAHE